MTNGQVNSVSAPAVIQVVSKQPTVSTTVNASDVPQNDSDFAGMLNDLQHQVKKDETTASGQKSQSANKSGINKSTIDSDKEDQAADLLTLLQVSPDIFPVPEAALPKSDDYEKIDFRSNETEHYMEVSEVKHQVALAISSESGRTPEVSVMASDLADSPQNVAAVEGPSAEIVALGNTKKMVMQQQPMTTLHQEKQTQPLRDSFTAVAVTSQLFQDDRTEEVSIPTVLNTAGQQNRVDLVEGDPKNIISALSGENHVKQTGTESEQSPVVLQSEKSVVNPDAEASALSAESELEIQLSQPRPITARVAAGDLRRKAPEQQAETIKVQNEAFASKESASALPDSEAGSELAEGSEKSQDGGTSKGQPDIVSDKQMLAQQLRGQLGVEYQKVSAHEAKAVATEPLRQENAGQIMQQVKDHLVQHDVKPGKQQITLTLSPDSLGELKMNLNLQGQKLSVEIVTESRSVRDAIAQHTDVLKESLARQNITMESFDVTSGGKGSGWQGQNQNAWRELAEQQQKSWTAPRGYRIAQADIPSESASYQRQQGQTMLDIHY